MDVCLHLNSVGRSFFKFSGASPPKKTKMGATFLPTSVRPGSSNSLSNHEDTACRRLQRGFASDQSSPLAPREYSRIEANLDWHLKALMHHSLNGNSAFFSRYEKATFAEILELGSMSQVPDPKKSKTVAPRFSNVFHSPEGTYYPPAGLFDSSGQYGSPGRFPTILQSEPLRGFSNTESIDFLSDTPLAESVCTS